MHISHSPRKFNVPEHRDAEDELRAKLLQLGRLLHKCGERPTAEIFAECVTLEPDVRDEMIARLEDFTRLGPELYRATGADKFRPCLVGVNGRRRKTGAK